MKKEKEKRKKEEEEEDEEESDDEEEEEEEDDDEEEEKQDKLKKSKQQIVKPAPNKDIKSKLIDTKTKLSSQKAGNIYKSKILSNQNQKQESNKPKDLNIKTNDNKNILNKNHPKTFQEAQTQATSQLKYLKKL